MSQPDPSKPGKPKPKATFFLHTGNPGDSGSASSGSSLDEDGHTGPIPARLISRPPRPARRAPAPTQPVPGAAGDPFAGAAASYYAAVPPPPVPPMELKLHEGGLARRRAAAGGISGAPAPTDARFGGAGHPAGSAYAGGGWQAGPATHAAGSDQPGPSNFAGSFGNPVSPAAHGHLPPPAPPQHPAAGRGRPAQGRPLQARRIAPRTETEEICKYCGKSFPVSKLTKHLTQAHPKYYPHLRY